MAGEYLDYSSELSLSHILTVFLFHSLLLSLNARKALSALVGAGEINEKRDWRHNGRRWLSTKQGQKEIGLILGYVDRDSLLKAPFKEKGGG